MLENVTKGLYCDTANAYVRSSIPSLPFPPLSLHQARSISRDPETSSRVPEHFIFALHATFAMPPLKNFVMDFVV